MAQLDSTVIYGDLKLQGDLIFNGDKVYLNSSSGEFYLTTGTSGSAKLIIEADEDNNNEWDQPTLELRQDAGLVKGIFGFRNGGNDLTIVLADNGGNAGIRFYTGPDTSNLSERVVISYGGSVGIGISTPKKTLHVNGGYYGKGHLFLYAYEGDGVDGTAYIQARDDSGTSSIDLQLRTQSAGSFVDVMRISSSGKVGIGTTSPTHKLNVVGDFKIQDANPRIIISDTDDTSNDVRLTYDNLSFSVQITDKNDVWVEDMIKAYKDGAVKLFYDGSVKLETTSTGVSITGDLSVSNLYFVNRETITASGLQKVYSGIRKQGITENLVFQMYGDGSTDRISFQTDYGNTGTWTERMAIIAQTGNVGIGTTSPSEKLEVDGNIKISNGWLVLGAVDGTYEGGEIRFEGAGSYTIDWVNDRCQDDIRWHYNGDVKLSLDTSGNLNAKSEISASSLKFHRDGNKYIRFDSDINYGSDYAIIKYVDDASTEYSGIYDISSSISENGTLFIVVENNLASTYGDQIVLRTSARCIIDANGSTSSTQDAINIVEFWNEGVQKAKVTTSGQVHATGGFTTNNWSIEQDATSGSLKFMYNG